MTDQNARGSEWKKWDLHVHTPLSLRQGYGGDTPEVWEKFIQEIENLPRCFAALGINDYWFLDGYKRLRNEHANGRMQNIDTLFPVIEMRLNQFGGSESKLSRANLHVIFDPELAPEVIESQFISALRPRFHLDASGENFWNASITRDSLEDLGRKMKLTVPPERLGDYDSDLVEGFNNANVTLEMVQEVLTGHVFKNRSLLALGKTEWADIKWADGAITSKKHLINIADIVFTAFDETTTWSKSRQTLIDNDVTSALLDCSDAHTWSTNTANKDRIGNCETWIRSTPTFAGLVHALSEFTSRVYVGTEPEDLRRRRESPERIIDSIAVRPVEGAASDLFNYSIPLNQGLVAIIGNKGQGKSALLDCLARGGNSSRADYFAFLNRMRFLNPKNKFASAFEAEVTLADKTTHVVGLAKPHDPANLERVEYLPQRLIETICASDPLSPENDAFEGELSRVLFHHIDEVDRSGEETLDGLLRLRTKSVDAALSRLRLDVDVKSVQLVHLDREMNEVTLVDLKKRRDETRLQVDAAVADLDAAVLNLKELEAGEAEPTEVASDRDALAQAVAEAETLDSQVATLTVEGAQVSKQLTELVSVEQAAQFMSQQASTLNLEYRKAIGIPAGDVVTVVIDSAAIVAARSERVARQLQITAELSKARDALKSLGNVCDALRIKLTAHDGVREAARRAVEQLRKRVEALTGDPGEPDSVSGLDARIRRVGEIPGEIEKLQNDLAELAKGIYSQLMSRIDTIRSVYKPAEEFARHDALASAAGITFDASIRFSSDWGRLSDVLDGRRNSELLSRLEDVRVSLDPMDEDEVVTATLDILKRMGVEGGDLSRPGRSLDTAFRSNTTPSETIAHLAGLTWLETSFSLSGNGIPLSQLSPGERGLILLLFYLVLDRSDTPLLLDQPEENLDNSAVRRVLVPALQQAKLRRQVIVVTHNANLAVVGDADQIVHCSYDSGVFTLHSGPLASLDTGEFVIDVLEGARPAFENRRKKYEEVVVQPLI
ncbi:TrlF family AAA-like ATPase [Paenarthrobacter sp. NPDC090517]|uniref:TrlF family AAA-like ATPase n=1 Tax=Paenarthrobacter sp. NPDC090517 TaxID=3364381 RepID=UPI003827027B